MTHQKTQLPDPHAAEGPEKVEHPNGFLQEQKPSDRSEETHHQLLEGEQSLADGSDTSPVITCSSIPPQQLEKGEAASGGQCALVTDAQSGESFNETKFVPYRGTIMLPVDLWLHYYVVENVFMCLSVHQVCHHVPKDLKAKF